MSASVAASGGEQQPKKIFFIFETPELNEDDFSGPLLNIMHSPLQLNGSIQGVYVNIEHGECFKVKPHSSYYDGESSFIRMLGELMRNGSYQDPTTNEVMLEKVANREAILAELPTNAYKIGCTSGGGHGVFFEDHIATVGEDIPIAVVAGDVTSAGVTNYLDAIVNVSQYKLTTATCVLDALVALGRNV